MVKKILGVVATLAILVLIVFTVLGAGSYKSLLPERWFSFGDEQGSEVVEQDIEPAAAVEEADSIATDSIATDSIAIENVEVAEPTEE